MQLNAEERYRIWLYDALRANGARMGALLASYGSAAAVFEAARAGELSFTGRRAESLEASLGARAKAAEIDALLDGYARMGITAVTRISENYPALLREIYDPPEVLFVKGTLRCGLRLPLAVIGARKCTEYGRGAARRFSRELAEAGACIVSGLAYGVDVEAARGAMESGSDYPTLAVQGCGVDIPYPLSNKKEYERIVACGAVLSELLPGTMPLPGFFPQRNRIISGLSRGVLVTEAAERSGTSITVGFALEQGRDVFAVPGRIDDVQSAGTNRYIRDGYAKAVLCSEDILCEYGLQAQSRPPQRVDCAALPPEQAALCALLAREALSFDALCEKSGLAAPRLNSILTVMEFSGIIRQTSGRMYNL